MLATPETDRHGLVFGIEGFSRGKPIDARRANRIVASIGEAALVVVDANAIRLRGNKKTGTVFQVPKCATAHDLRRAFGARWSKRVMPIKLQKLMRHASIETAMRYNVEHNADDVFVNLWNWRGNVSGSVAPEMQSAALKAAESEERKSLVPND